MATTVIAPIGIPQPPSPRAQTLKHAITTSFSGLFKPDTNTPVPPPPYTNDLPSNVCPFLSLEWRDVTLQSLGFVFDSELAELRWKVVRDHVKIYPFLIHTMREFFRRNPAVYEDPSRLQFVNEFEKEIGIWLSWDPIEALSKCDDIAERICTVVVQFTAEIAYQVSPSVPKWVTVFQFALSYDREDTSRMIGKMMSDRQCKERILSLTGNHLYNVQNVLQTLIGFRCTNSRDLVPLLHKLVMRGSTLPSGLLVTGVYRIGDNPVAGGGFADVWKGWHKSEDVALKVLRIFGTPEIRAATLKDFCKEAMLWKLFKHDNICPFYGVSMDEFAPSYAFVSPWMPNGNLLGYVRDHPEVDRVKILGEVALGLCYLHMFDPQVIHGDVRSANVLIDASGRPRISDFGLAKIIDSHATTMASSSFSGQGSVRWQAPELLDSSRFQRGSCKITTKSDVFAFACVCLEVFTGEIPWAGFGDGMVITEVCIRDQRPPRPEEPATQRGLNDDIWNLMQLCWKTQPEERPEMITAVALLMPDHQWKEEMEDHHVAVEDTLSACLERCSALVHSEPVNVTITGYDEKKQSQFGEKPRRRWRCELTSLGYVFMAFWVAIIVVIVVVVPILSVPKK